MARAVGRRRSVPVLERGDIVFFYRPRVVTGEVAGREDVQRFFLVLAPDRRALYRLFVVGRKGLPDVRPGEARPEERHWGVNALTAREPERLRDELAARTYATATRGERWVGAAKPVGEGRYQLVTHLDHTELVYALELPKRPGPAQEEFGIRERASYIVAVKNPAIRVPEFPSAREPARYPERLLEKFGERRWIPADPELLDYEGTEILLIGAHGENVEAELGLHIDKEAETQHTAEVFRRLKVRKQQAALAPLLDGEFPAREGPESARAS
jgi:hypothetical protein